MSREFEFVTSMKKVKADLFCQTQHSSQLIHIPLIRTRNDLISQETIEGEGEGDSEISEDIYEIKIKRNKSGSVVDYEYDFTVNPIYFYYRALLLKIIKSFTTIGTKSSEELKVNAWDKFQNVKEQTQNRIKSALLQTTNILRGSILNPKVILPYTQNNDRQSPAYVLCLGDFKVNANKENLNEKLYKYLECSIRGIQFQYFQTMLLWEQYERDHGRESAQESEFFQCLNARMFNVIEELEISFKIGQRKKEVALTEDKDKHPQFLVEGKVSDIRINLTSERYNSLINFNKMIEMTNKNFANNIILHEKEDILKMAVKKGNMRKKGETLEYWDMFYAVLSGSYLYFYQEDGEDSDSYHSWIYLKDTVVKLDTEGSDEESENIFILSNRSTTLHLFVSDEDELKDWVKCIRERVYEIGSINDSFDNQEQQLSRSRKRRASLLTVVENIPEITIVRVNLHFDTVKFNLVHEDYSNFLNFKISQMFLTSNTVTNGEFSSVDGLPKSIDDQYSNKIHMNVQKFTVYDVRNSMMMLDTKNPLVLTVNILSKTSKEYTGDKVTINLEADIAHLNFFPDSIKYMVTFLKRVDYEGGNAALVGDEAKFKPEERLESSLKSTVNKVLVSSKRKLSLESIESADDKSRKTEDEDNKVTLSTKNVLKVNLNIERVKLTMINPFNMKPFVYMDVQSFNVVYELYQVHHHLQISAKDFAISADSPIFNTFKVAEISQEWHEEHNENSDLPFKLDMKIFKDEFMNPNQKISNILNIDLGGVCLHYQQENIMRIKEYFFDKFLDALTGSEKVQENLKTTKKWFQNDNSDSPIDYSEFDLKQDDKFTKIYMRIESPKIFLVDRPHFKDGFRFDIEEITFENMVKTKKGRWYNYPEKEFGQNKFIIKLTKAVLSHDENIVSNFFNLRILIKGLTDSPVEDEIPHQELDKSLHIKIICNELLKLSMTQHTYGYLLRCLDLNINFNDDRQHEYQFKNFIDLEKLHMQEENCVSMRLNVRLKYLSVVLLNYDRTFMAEVFYNKALITMVDKGQKDLKVIANKFFILDKPERETKQLILGPTSSKNVLSESDLMVIGTKKNSHVMEIIMKQNGDKSIVWNLDRVKVFLKTYSIMKALKFFTEAIPDYDYSIEKPNGYYKRNGELESKDPGSKMTVIINFNKSMYLLTDDPTSERVIVIEGHLNFNFQRENYIKCKELLKAEYDKDYNKARMMNSMVSLEGFDPQGDIQMPVGSMTLNLLDTCIKISKMSNIKKSKKWLITP